MTSETSQSTPNPPDSSPSHSSDAVWQYYRFSNPLEPSKDSVGRRNRFCLLCPRPTNSTGHRGNASSHLRKAHGIRTSYNPDNRIIAIKTQSSIEDGMLRQREKISEAAEEKVRGSFDRKHFLELKALFIVRRRLPFHIVT
ncbi:hypothetical protein K402DRAFT_398879 [Aulographum hederae CBS 113979]|uniref:BED-type domain-containing protein n=1 Tax=Aulographum hederae CBS 113979 TaxID=1176131 RepID=A0A6G1GJY4_9PEZI|nr:hypothetical protein K402DRAFT_398879 [Aulographum hederae CBS 113979]